MADWYYSNQGQQLGPVSREELRRLAVEGILQPTDMIWKQGMPDWVPVSSAKGLLPGSDKSKAASDTALPARTTLEPMPAQPARTALESTPRAVDPRHAVTANSAEAVRAPQPPRGRGSRRPMSDPLPTPVKQGGSKRLLFGIIGGVAVVVVGLGVLLFIMLRPGTSRSFSVAPGDIREFEVEFEKGKWIEMSVETENGGDVDLYVFDKDNERVAVDTKPGDTCFVEFFPKNTQTYRLEIRGKGGHHDDFLIDDDYVAGTVKWKIRDISELSEIARKSPDKIDEALNFNDRNEQGRYVKSYLFHLDKKNAYTIEMLSRFDNMVKVLDVYDDELAKIDHNPGRNGRLFFQPPKAGVYKIVATSFHGQHTGPFSLNVRPKSAADDTTRSFMLGAFETTRFDLTLKKGELMEVALKDPGPRTKLRVLDITNQPVAAIDAGDAKVLFMPPKTQPYRVEISRRDNIAGDNGFLATVQWQPRTMDELAKLARKAPAAVETKLENSDPKLNGNKYHKTFLFQMDATQSYTIEMLSSFENYLAVNDLSDTPRLVANANQPSTNTRVFFQPAKSGVFKIVAAASRPFHTGDFKLAVRPKSALDDVSRSFMLKGGQKSQFNVSLTKGNLIEISVKENLSNVDLRVMGNNNQQVATLDESDSRPKVLFVPSGTQSYRVELHNKNNFAAAPVSGTVQWQVRKLSDLANLARQTPATIKSTIDRNTRRQSGKYAKTCLVYLKGKQDYTFDVFGSFDNYIQVKHLSGEALATSSLSTRTPNARMFYQPKASGVYQVEAGPISGYSTGTMTVNVREKTTADSYSQPFLLTRYQTARFHVTPQPGKAIEFSVKTKSTNKVSIRVYGTSRRNRTFASAETVNGLTKLAVTPNPGETSLRIEVSNRNLSDTIPAAGYVTWQAGTATVGGPNPLPGGNGGAKVVLSKTGTLGPGDVMYLRTKYAEVYSVLLERNKTYTISMTSQFDNYLVLQDSRGRNVRVDDDGGPGLNAQIVYRPLTSAVYRIVATTYSARQTGAFTLIVTAR